MNHNYGVGLHHNKRRRNHTSRKQRRRDIDEEAMTTTLTVAGILNNLNVSCFTLPGGGESVNEVIGYNMGKA